MKHLLKQSVVTTHHLRGFGLVEVLVAVSIIAITSVSIFNVYTAYLRAELNNVKSVKAAFLMEEGLEVVRLLRDTSWSSYIAPVTASTTQYLNWTGSAWQFTTTPQMIDTRYARTVVFTAVYRDANNRIAASGTLDPNTRGFTVAVAWPDDNTALSTTTKQISSYITNLYGN